MWGRGPPGETNSVMVEGEKGGSNEPAEGHNLMHTLTKGPVPGGAGQGQGRNLYPINTSLYGMGNCGDFYPHHYSTSTTRVFPIEIQSVKNGKLK